MKDQGGLGRVSNHKLKICGTAHLGGHDMVRRVDRHGEALTWCRKCSGYARCRLVPKLINRCKPEKMDTKEYGKLKRIFALEEGTVLDRNAREKESPGKSAKS